MNALVADAVVRINSREDLLTKKDVVVHTQDGQRVWYRGVCGEELRFTQPVKGNVCNGRSITDLYYSLSQVEVVATNRLTFQGSAREDTYTDSIFASQRRFMLFMNTQLALEARGVY